MDPGSKHNRILPVHDLALNASQGCPGAAQEILLWIPSQGCEHDVKLIRVNSTFAILSLDGKRLILLFESDCPNLGLYRHGRRTMIHCGRIRHCLLCLQSFVAGVSFVLRDART